MSEAVLVRGVLVGHGDMPAGMVDAVRQITGCPPEALVPISNRGLSPDALATAVSDAVGSGPAIVFTDLQSGSCMFVARRLAQSAASLAVISGANLPVLIDFVMNRSQPIEQLAPHLLTRGRAAMGCAPANPEGHEHRAVPGR